MFSSLIKSLKTLSLWYCRYCLFFSVRIIFMSSITFIKILSLDFHLSEIKICPSSLNDIQPPSNNLSWLGHNNNPLFTSSFSSLLLFAHGFIWLATRKFLSFTLHKQQLEYRFKSNSLNTDWLILIFVNAFFLPHIQVPVLSLFQLLMRYYSNVPVRFYFVHL